MTTLTAETVEATFAACLADHGTEVEGIVSSATFDAARIADHAELIATLLYELPEQFRASGGGGWSFLNACDDRHGNQWTGLYITMERLFMLGIAAGLVECQLPRDMWKVLPGGMPYYVVKDAA
jgi:hypothetical protein